MQANIQLMAEFPTAKYLLLWESPPFSLLGGLTWSFVISGWRTNYLDGRNQSSTEAGTELVWCTQQPRVSHCQSWVKSSQGLWRQKSRHGNCSELRPTHAGELEYIIVIQKITRKLWYSGERWNLVLFCPLWNFHLHHGLVYQRGGGRKNPALGQELKY